MGCLCLTFREGIFTAPRCFPHGVPHLKPSPVRVPENPALLLFGWGSRFGTQPATVRFFNKESPGATWPGLPCGCSPLLLCVGGVSLPGGATCRDNLKQAKTFRAIRLDLSWRAALSWPLGSTRIARRHTAMPQRVCFQRSFGAASLDENDDRPSGARFKNGRRAESSLVRFGQASCFCAGPTDVFLSLRRVPASVAAIFRSARPTRPKERTAGNSGQIDRVRVWHKADIPRLTVFVRFRGEADIDSRAASASSVANDAVDGAHSAASRCHRVVASKRTT
jgi:hypothetical protein